MNRRHLNPAEFARVKKIAYREAGIDLVESKVQMASARVRTRMKEAGIGDFTAYLAHAEKNPAELARLVDQLTTNETRFFREPKHWEMLAKEFWPKAKPPLRVWCAAASTGEEPYTISMSMLENVPGHTARDARILATDISPTVLATAKAGRYTVDRLKGVPAALRSRYFTQDRQDPEWMVASQRLRAPLSFAQLNLMNPWPMRGPFDLILLRNVMIYFDAPTRHWLCRRMASLLRPGGLLLIGHSETLGDNSPGLKRARPAVYIRNNDRVQVGSRAEEVSAA